MDKIEVKSPAKVNLFLKVLDKRPDGYHNIETIFERIDLCDKVTLRKTAEGISVASSNPKVPVGAENTAYRAARELFKEKGLKAGVDIHIEKNIPISAGLGGGSSNAAAVLLGLNKLYDLKLTTEELSLAAKKIGADVAFFVSECSFAKGTQRGDVITRLESDLNLWHILATPPFGLLAKDIYGDIDSRDQKNNDSGSEAVAESFRNKDLASLGKALYNDLEDAACNRYPELRDVKKILTKKGAEAALVSGSGPVVFGLMKTRKEALGAAESLKKEVLVRKKEWQVHVAKTT